MISFGEINRKSIEWRMEISTVEKIYALDWLLKGIYDRAALANGLILRGASALADGYFADYPHVEDVDFARDPGFSDEGLARELASAAESAVRESGLKFRMHAFQSSEARFEFTGPLGRRSAAQPLIVLRFRAMQTHIEPTASPLIHPFSDNCAATVRAVALEELAAERIVLLGQSPRVRDVFDLWFILKHAEGILDVAKTRELVQVLAGAKGITPRGELNPQYAPLLARGWENALKEIPNHPTFENAQAEILNWIGHYIGKGI